MTDAPHHTLVDAVPSPQTALDLFAGQWWSQLPHPFAKYKAGFAHLFNDYRIRLFERVSSFYGKRVLELGPREAHHSYMLTTRGAHVTAVEGNGEHFLKCLIVKELLQLRNVDFLCGDFIKFLTTSHDDYDACVAVGVLYHQVEPLKLLALLAAKCDTLHLWSHYYCRSQCNRTQHCPVSDDAERIAFGGFGCNAHRHDYTQERTSPQYMGGLSSYSLWLERQAILDALEHFGYKHVTVHEDELHDNGPAITLTACKDAP